MDLPSGCVACLERQQGLVNELVMLLGARLSPLQLESALEQVEAICERNGCGARQEVADCCQLSFEFFLSE